MAVKLRVDFTSLITCPTSWSPTNPSILAWNSFRVSLKLSNTSKTRFALQSNIIPEVATSGHISPLSLN